MPQQLNDSFKSFLLDPFDQDAWADFDLACIFLTKQGYSFIEESNTDTSIFPFKTKAFDLKQQLEFIYIEQKKALDLQLFDYLNNLIDYKKVLSACLNKELPEIKIFGMDYYWVQGAQIHFILCSHPLINLKILTIISRRRRKLYSFSSK